MRRRVGGDGGRRGRRRGVVGEAKLYPFCPAGPVGKQFAETVPQLADAWVCDEQTLAAAGTVDAVEVGREREDVPPHLKVLPVEKALGRRAVGAGGDGVGCAKRGRRLSHAPHRIRMRRL